MKLYSYLTGPDDDSFCHRVTERLNRSNAVALADPKTRERFVAGGMQAWTGANTPDSARAIVDIELKRFRAIGERTGIKITG